MLRTLPALLLALHLLAPCAARAAEPSAVRVVSDDAGQRLTVDGQDFMVLGMNWDYFPVGTNYTYDFWSQPDELIEAALANELPLMKRMGVNAIRVYVGIPKRWVAYIHEKYGIWTILNHTVGRYGSTVGGVWVANTDYSDPRFRAAMKAEVAALVDGYKGTPGVLLWLLGNENNYGLSWSSFEIEALPQGERDAARAKHLYSLYGELVRDIKARDPNHPVAIANGDLQYVDLIASEVKGLDILGTNVYRGASFRDLFAVVKEKLGIPVLFTEFGADAYDAKRRREDDVTQARYLVAQWREIYEQSSGKGRAGNAIGGTVFQWSDGWWKYRQETNLETHDTNASWPNAAYPEDLVEGQNNMNEEWWGICAKGLPDARGLYALQPRTAYYALQQAWRLPPYGASTDLTAIAAHFGGIEPSELAYHYKADQAVSANQGLERLRISNVRLSLETFSTGGNARWARAGVPNADGFDHTESVYVEAAARPIDGLEARAEVNVLGHVAENPIDEIYYERRGRPVPVLTGGGVVTDPDTGAPVFTPTTRSLDGLDRVRLYRASVAWEEDWFRMDGFFRTGHYHWAAEGDLLGLYREANYGLNTDIYDADVPFGFEVAGKRSLDGLKLAFGPALWWGANPSVMGKYRHQLGRATLTLVHQEDLAQARNTGLSSAIPEPSGRKTALSLEAQALGAGLELSALWSGSSRVGRVFIDDAGAPDRVRDLDTLGARAKLTYERGPLHWYAQGAYMGLVADAGPDPRVTYTGWTLKDSGSGNQVNALTGFALTVGDFQLGPNFLWQKPLVGPGRSALPFAGGGPAARNIEADPFVVRSNRETVAGELMLVYDPTPATWAWAWDNDLREDAPFMASVDVAYRHQPTAVDATFYFSDTGERFAFPKGVPAADTWEVSARAVSALTPSLRLVGHAFAGNPQANGEDARRPRRYGGDLRMSWRSLVVQGAAKVNDWGPYDYHRDFNLTFPLQLVGDVSYVLGPARWLWQQQTRLGVRATSRQLNGYSGGRYVQDRQAPTKWGHEYEVRTYVVVTM